MLPTKYRVSRDECGDPEIRTRTGAICEFSPHLLGVQIDGYPKIAARLSRMGYAVAQDGDQKVTFLVPRADLDRIAGLIRPRRKRQLTPEAKAALALRFRRPEQKGFSAQEPRGGVEATVGPSRDPARS